MGVFETDKQDRCEEQIGLRIIETVERRPCTVAELAASLGVPEESVERESLKLQKQGKLNKLCFDGKLFLRPAE